MLRTQLIVILRHNTSLQGDADLALREWNSILGPCSRLLDKEALKELLCPMSDSCLPILTRSLPWVAAVWNEVSIPDAAQLIRRSAFAQEVFGSYSSDNTIDRALRLKIGEALDRASAFSRPYFVALAHNYIIESEGVLDATINTDRISTVVRALLEPYTTARSTPLSSKVRAAKKTTLSLSHDLHIYKAKFFPRMVRALINIYGRDSVIFDPYCGSGTALLEAALLGQNSIGSDIDPICETIALSKVTPFTCRANSLKKDLTSFRNLLDSSRGTAAFIFPEELKKKLARRDRIDGTHELPQIVEDAGRLAEAIRKTKARGPALDLVRTLASDAVTKKIRYRFVGVGNGRYTIEIVKQSIIDRFQSKLERAIQLIDVFSDLESELKITVGRASVFRANAESLGIKTKIPAGAFVITSPPYLPASSGREHYASSRALSFAILNVRVSDDDNSQEIDQAGALTSFDGLPESERLMTYLVADSSASADPQRDAMRFERKAIPTARYLIGMGNFAQCLKNILHEGRLAMVVANQHTFYSHRRSEIEHVVNCGLLYSQILGREDFRLDEKIELQLLKSAASRAKPRAKDDYHEAILLFTFSDEAAHICRTAADNREPMHAPLQQCSLAREANLDAVLFGR